MEYLFRNIKLSLDQTKRCSGCKLKKVYIGEVFINNSWFEIRWFENGKSTSGLSQFDIDPEKLKSTDSM